MFRQILREESQLKLSLVCELFPNKINKVDPVNMFVIQVKCGIMRSLK